VSKVRRTTYADRKTAKITYDNGDSIHYAMSRSADRLTVTQPKSDPKLVENHSKAIMRKINLVQDRSMSMDLAMDKIAALMASFNCVEDFAKEGK